MLNGDFSNTSQFSGLSNSFVSTVPSNLVNGRIPANQIDPNGQALLRLLPRPNADPAQTGGYNYVDSVELDQNMHQWLTRVDVNVSDNTRIFARYNLQTETQNFPVGLWWRNANQVPYPTAVTAPNRSHSTTVSLTHVFGPSLTSESTFAATFIDFPNQFEDPSRVSRSALGYTNPGIYDSGLDQIPSLTGWGNGPTMFNPGGFDPVLFAKKWLISGAQSVTKVSGAHTIKAGAYYEWVNNSQPGNGDSNGRLAFSAGATGSTGNYFADALIGQLAEYGEQSPNVVRDMAYNIFEGYIQDSWKANNRLTIDGGLRLSHLGGWYERNGVGMAVFDPALYDSQAPGTTFRGLTWTDINPDVPTSGVEVQSIFCLAARRLRLRPLGRRLDAASRRLRHVQLPRRAGAVLRLHRPALRRDVHERRRQSDCCATCRTSIRTRSPASAARSWRLTTSSRGPRAGASRCSAACRIR